MKSMTFVAALVVLSSISALEEVPAISHECFDRRFLESFCSAVQPTLISFDNQP